MVESYMVRYEDVKPLPLEHREDFAKNLARILLGRGGLPTSGWCLFRATFSPGGYHADHIHTKCDETRLHHVGSRHLGYCRQGLQDRAGLRVLRSQGPSPLDEEHASDGEYRGGGLLSRGHPFRRHRL